MGQRRLPKLRRPGYGEPLGKTWRLVWLLFYAPVAAIARTRYLHIERVPQQGAAILVVNHVSHVDPFLVGKFVIDAARTPRFLAKDSIFGFFGLGAAMRAMGHIPVKRGTADARQSLDAAVRACSYRLRANSSLASDAMNRVSWSTADTTVSCNSSIECSNTSLVLRPMLLISRSRALANVLLP